MESEPTIIDEGVLGRPSSLDVIANILGVVPKGQTSCFPGCSFPCGTGYVPFQSAISGTEVCSSVGRDIHVEPYLAWVKPDVECPVTHRKDTTRLLSYKTHEPSDIRLLLAFGSWDCGLERVAAGGRRKCGMAWGDSVSIQEHTCIIGAMFTNDECLTIKLLQLWMVLVDCRISELNGIGSWKALCLSVVFVIGLCTYNAMSGSLNNS